MIRSALLVAVALASHSSAVVAQPKPPACDATCLTDLANRYMDAMLKHDPKGLPWADRVGYAENGVKVRIGESSWATVDAKGAAPLIVADAQAGRVVWSGTINDHGQPAYYAMEMKVEGGKIASVEAIIRRKEGRQPFADPLAFKADPAFAATVPTVARSAPQVMTGLARAYLAAQSNRKDAVAPGFGTGCALVENGVAMTGNLPAATGASADCATAFKRGLFKEIEAIRYSIAAVDPARGIVAAIGYRDLPAAEVTFKATDGKDYAAEAKYPRSVGFVTLFKIEGGKIARVQTVANEVPYLMPQPFGR
ncbi:MAG: hypothetical protein J7494_04385 [Sphingobium sp.]|nr:hypothetical protein [Sphingobium sp.]